MSPYAGQRGLELLPIAITSMQVTLANAGILDLDETFVGSELRWMWNGMCREEGQRLAAGMNLSCALGGGECLERHGVQFLVLVLSGYEVYNCARRPWLCCGVVSGKSPVLIPRRSEEKPESPRFIWPVWVPSLSGSLGSSLGC